MPHRTTTSASPATARSKRGRASRPLSLRGALPNEHAADAMDDESVAGELMSDLVALVEAVLVAPVTQAGAVRYAPADPGDIDAWGVNRDRHA